jgi:hypothetical protein
MARLFNPLSLRQVIRRSDPTKMSGTVPRTRTCDYATIFMAKRDISDVIKLTKGTNRVMREWGV